MANLSELDGIIVDLFGVLGTLIDEVVTLLTGDLLVLAVVGAFIGLIIGLIVLLFNYVRSIFNNSVKMKK